MTIPISTGSGAASVAAEVVGGVQYQQIEILGQGGASTLGVNPDGSSKSSIIGVPTFTIGGGSVLSIPTGSVITVIQGSSILSVPVGSTITVLQGSSILAVPVGSTIGVLQAPSIVGTYQGGSGGTTHTGGDRGLFAEGVRNDTLASITSGDKIYSPFATGPAGEVIIADSPYTKWVQGTADFRTNSGASVAVIAAQGASIFTYVREIQLANMGSASVLVTFGGATDSIIAYSIAPAGGGSNYVTRIKTRQNADFSASISGQASVLLTATGFIAKV